MSFVRESILINGKPLTLETGRLAKQAHGSILITYGESVVLVTRRLRRGASGLDFFPLTCEYFEKTFAAGKIPGGFFNVKGASATKKFSRHASSIARAVRSFRKASEGHADHRDGPLFRQGKTRPTSSLSAAPARPPHLGHPLGRPARRRPRLPRRRPVHRLPDVRPAGKVGPRHGRRLLEGRDRHGRRRAPPKPYAKKSLMRSTSPTKRLSRSSN